MTAYSLGKRSLEKLCGVDPRLINIVMRAIVLTKQDFSVTCGIRSREEQRKLYAQGRTKPGDIVTWTLNSRHFPDADGYGRAVDLEPYPSDWKDLSKFDAISKAMFQAAKDLGIKIRWGADWDQDGNPRERGESDSPHFELE